MKYPVESTNALFADRAPFMGVGVVPSLDGGKGYDVVLRLDGTYFGDEGYQTAEGVARLMGVMVRDAIAATPNMSGDELMKAFRQLQRYQPGILAATYDDLWKTSRKSTPAHTCWLCEKPCEPHAFYLASDNETAQAICEPCGEENTTDTCGCCGAKGDSVEINELIEITDDRFPAQTYIAMCSKCEVESDRLSRELDQETP